ncbi:MAG TPA: pyridoxal phosphate-dependent aminotransferase family protein, partial [Methylomirabilota bacterium]|nr:pyridoxal phosphate-dependent aminotransferase family protein [Methylomirabilota bacterium]
MSAGPVTESPLQYLEDALVQLKQDGLYRRLRRLEGEQLPRARFDGHPVVNLSSNNYLGLTTHPKMREAALQAVRELGVGSGSVRTIAGTMELHMELERRIAAFKKTEASVVFQSGFAANAGTVSALLGKGALILSDELNHASIIDGARLSRADIRVYPHRDVQALESLLEETRNVK